MKSEGTRNRLLEEFKTMPVVEVACKKAGVGRATYYSWRKNAKFKGAADAALMEGERFLTDMAETQLISLMRDKHFPSIALWLRTHHPKYATRVELAGEVTLKLDPLSAHEQELVTRAIQLLQAAPTSPPVMYVPPESKSQDSDPEQGGQS